MVKKMPTIFPISNSNQITKDYYYTVLEMQNNGTTNLIVSKNFMNNGSYHYVTYHLISSK